MSGICGIFHFDGKPVAESSLVAMMNAAPHRGPDSSRHFVSENLGLGYLGLELTPESIGEGQPVAHPPSGVRLVADLRLDNRDELLGKFARQVSDLLGSDRTPADPELLLSAYLADRDRYAAHILGDFVYALHDPRRESLELARDIMGVRTLYYRLEPRRVLFATEAKQILAVPGVPKRLNETTVAAHMAGVPTSHDSSFFEGIHQVIPGESIVFRNGSPVRSRIREIPSEPIRGRERDVYAGFRDVFLEAVRCRLRSSGPAALSLSGGLDSGSIAAAAGRLKQRGESGPDPDLRAYTWAFDELSSCDERTVSREIAARSAMPLVEVPGDQAWPLARPEAHIPDMDDPYLFYYHTLIDQVLSRARKDGVRLMMTGERGDAVTNQWVYDCPGLLSAGRFPTLLRELSAHARESNRSLYATAKRRLMLPLLEAAGYRGTARRRTAAGLKLPPYLRPEFVKRTSLKPDLDDFNPAASIRNPARRARGRMIFSSICTRRLTLLERHQAAHGIAYADPWSDRRVAEYVVSMPQYSVHGITDFKRLTRKSFEEMLPDSLTNLDSGAGKADPTPLFRRGVYDRARQQVRDLLTDTRAAEFGFVDERRLRDDYEAALGDRPLSYDLWWFLTLELWLRRYW